jgi:hypothetical protein
VNKDFDVIADSVDEDRVFRDFLDSLLKLILFTWIQVSSGVSNVRTAEEWFVLLVELNFNISR